MCCSFLNAFGKSCKIGFGLEHFKGIGFGQDVFPKFMLVLWANSASFFKAAPSFLSGKLVPISRKIFYRVFKSICYSWFRRSFPGVHKPFLPFGSRSSFNKRSFLNSESNGETSWAICRNSSLVSHIQVEKILVTRSTDSPFVPIWHQPYFQSIRSGMVSQSISTLVSVIKALLQVEMLVFIFGKRAASNFLIVDYS